jgi:hypothetical protein
MPRAAYRLFATLPVAAAAEGVSGQETGSADGLGPASDTRTRLAGPSGTPVRPPGAVPDSLAVPRLTGGKPE